METRFVTSLEMSRKLDKAGVKQESEFYWVNSHNGYALGHPSRRDTWNIVDDKLLNSISAFLLSELKEISRGIINSRGKNTYTWKSINRAFCSWLNEQEILLAEIVMWSEYILYLKEGKKCQGGG